MQIRDLPTRKDRNRKYRRFKEACQRRGLDHIVCKNQILQKLGIKNFVDLTLDQYEEARALIRLFPNLEEYKEKEVNIIRV